MIRAATPLICIPLSAGMNVWSTGAVAGVARQTYRDKALSDEKANRFVDASADDRLLVSVVWAAIQADCATTAEEICRLKDLIRSVDQAEGFDAEGSDLGIDLDVVSLLVKAAALGQDERETLFNAACFAVAFDRKVHKKEKEFLDRLAAATGIDWDSARLKEMIRTNTV
jgi:uncharacterized membrane protein YebE (DUF533 family)